MINLDARFHIFFLPIEKKDMLRDVRTATISSASQNRSSKNEIG